MAAATPQLDPFAAENRVEGDPSASRDEEPDMGEESLEVAPPAAAVEDDIWRDYNPGSKSNEEEEAVHSISELVSESLSETDGDRAPEAAEKGSDDHSSDAEHAIEDGPVLTNGEEPVGAGASRDT